MALYTVTLDNNRTYEIEADSQAEATRLANETAQESGANVLSVSFTSQPVTAPTGQPSVLDAADEALPQLAGTAPTEKIYNTSGPIALKGTESEPYLLIGDTKIEATPSMGKFYEYLENSLPNKLLGQLAPIAVQAGKKIGKLTIEGLTNSPAFGPFVQQAGESEPNFSGFLQRAIAESMGMQGGYGAATPGFAGGPVDYGAATPGFAGATGLPGYPGTAGTAADLENRYVQAGLVPGTGPMFDVPPNFAAPSVAAPPSDFAGPQPYGPAIPGFAAPPSDFAGPQPYGPAIPGFAGPGGAVVTPPTVVTPSSVVPPSGGDPFILPPPSGGFVSTAPAKMVPPEGLATAQGPLPTVPDIPLSELDPYGAYQRALGLGSLPMTNPYRKYLERDWTYQGFRLPYEFGRAFDTKDISGLTDPKGLPGEAPGFGSWVQQVGSPLAARNLAGSVFRNVVGGEAGPEFQNVLGGPYRQEALDPETGMPRIRIDPETGESIPGIGAYQPRTWGLLDEPEQTFLGRLAGLGHTALQGRMGSAGYNLIKDLLPGVSQLYNQYFDQAQRGQQVAPSFGTYLQGAYGLNPYGA